MNQLTIEHRRALRILGMNADQVDAVDTGVQMGAINIAQLIAFIMALLAAFNVPIPPLPPLPPVPVP